MGDFGLGKLAGDVFNLFDDPVRQKVDALNKDAQLKQSALDETMRRAEGAQTQVLSSTQARMAGTGFSSDSNSYKSYLTNMAAEFQSQDAVSRGKAQGAIDLQKKAAFNLADGHSLFQGLGIMSDVVGTVASMWGMGGSSSGVTEPNAGNSGYNTDE